MVTTGNDSSKELDLRSCKLIGGTIGIFALGVYNSFLAFGFKKAIWELEEYGYPSWKALGTQFWVLFGVFPVVYVAALAVWLWSNRLVDSTTLKKRNLYLSGVILLLYVCMSYFCWFGYYEGKRPVLDT